MDRATLFQSKRSRIACSAIVVVIMIIGAVVALRAGRDSLESAFNGLGSAIETAQIAFRRNPVAVGVKGDSLEVVVVTCKDDPVTEIGGEVVGPSGTRSFRAQPVAGQAIVAQDRPGQQQLPDVWRIDLGADQGTIAQVEGTLPSVATDRTVTMSVVTRSSTYRQEVSLAGLSDGSVLVNGATYPTDEFVDSIGPFSGAVSLRC